MFLLQQLLQRTLAAVLLCGVLAIAGQRGTKNHWADTVELAFGSADGHAVPTGWPALPVSEATQLLAYFALAGISLGGDAWSRQYARFGRTS
jgi:hypothetical protein